MTNKTTRHVERLTELYEHQASDYFRRRNQRRLAYDICLFFLAGVLFLLLAEIATAEPSDCRTLDCVISRLEKQENHERKDRRSVWVEREREPLSVSLDGKLQLEHSERSIFSEPQQPVQIQIQRQEPTYCIGCDRRTR